MFELYTKWQRLTLLQQIRVYERFDNMIVENFPLVLVQKRYQPALFPPPVA